MPKTSRGQPHTERTSSAKKKPASISADLVAANRKLRREIAEHKHADEQLRLLSKAIEQSQSTVVITDPNGHIEYINPKFVQLTGYSVEEALGQNPRMVKSGETSPEEYKRLWATITAGQAWHGIFHNKKKSGELYWEEANISPVFDANGQITHFVAVKEDITERKQAEQALRESEERIRSILETTVNGIITINERGIVESINRAARSMFGYAENEVIGQNIKMLMPDPYHTEHDGYLDNYLRTGTKKIIGIGREVTVLRKNGTTFPMSLAVSEVRVGDLHLFTGIVQDVTERKQAEQFIEREKQKYEELFNTARRQAQEMALLNEVQTALAREVDLSDLIRTVVEAIAKAFGYTQVSVYLRQNDVLRMHDQVGYEHPILEIPMTQGVMARSVRTGSVIYLPDVRSDPDFIGAIVGINSEICVPLFDQQQAVGVLNVESTIGNLLTEADVRLISVLSQQVNIALGRARLVGELRRQAEELHTRNIDLDTFAHTVAHDLKSPISAVIGFSELLLTDYRDLPETTVQESLQNILYSGKKMDQIIEELMLLTGVRQQEIVPALIDIGSTVNDALKSLSDVIQQTGAQTSVPDQASWPQAVGYAPWIEQVWINYLSNALKYGGQPPQIELGAERSADQMARFWVRDNGSGLSPEECDRLFTPFTRLNQIRVTGHGLGLSIVRRIVEKLGGEVGVESQVGRGSTFFFTLPIALQDN